MARSWWLAGWLIVLTGCGQHPATEMASSKDSFSAEGPAEGVAARSDDGGQGPLGGQVELPRDRKIIYKAQVHLVVEQFEQVEREIPRLVEQFDGYLADASIQRRQGTSRTARWVARIPVDKHAGFLESLQMVGVAERQQQTAEDVTEQYLDLEARTENKQRLEQRLLKLLEERAGELKDVIDMERELARVREEIERMQGRLQYLANRTSLSTVEIHAREQRGYTPPQAPTFTARAALVWDRSWTNLLDFGQLLGLAAVGLTPWLVPLLLLIAPPLLYFRRWRRA